MGGDVSKLGSEAACAVSYRFRKEEPFRHFELPR